MEKIAEKVLTQLEREKLIDVLRGDNNNCFCEVKLGDVAEALKSIAMKPRPFKDGGIAIPPPKVEIKCDISQFERMMEESMEHMRQLKRSQYLHIPEIVKDALLLKMTCESCPEQYDVFYGEHLIAYIRFRDGRLTVNPYDKNGELAWQNDLLDMNFHNHFGVLDLNVRESVLDICKCVIADFYRE